MSSGLRARFWMTGASHMGHNRLRKGVSRLGRLIGTGPQVPSGGQCPVCRRRTLYLRFDANLRESLACIWCGSNARGRALMLALQRATPALDKLDVYEPGAGGPLSSRLSVLCKSYATSQYVPSVAAGTIHNGTRSENLEALSFSDGSFDVVVTQDVLEHVLCPDRAFSEIARVLRPGGFHIFTVPYHRGQPTARRVRIEADGAVVHLVEPEYHDDPLNVDGALVATDWGEDLPHTVDSWGPTSTALTEIVDRRAGVPAREPTFVSWRHRANNDV